MRDAAFFGDRWNAWGGETRCNFNNNTNTVVLPPHGLTVSKGAAIFTTTTMQIEREEKADVNLGIYDGDVPHREINQAVSLADKVILFGEQTRLPHFPEDVRLPKLHAADDLVLLFWKVLNKIPDNLRRALIYGPISLTIVRDDALLSFRDYRHHQAVHIGRRRNTIYMPEVLLKQAEETGYDYWAIAEGLIYAGWMLLDYALLVDVLTAHGSGPANTSGRAGRLSEPYLRAYVRTHNRHRRPHPERAKCELEEFIDGYKSAVVHVGALNAFSTEPLEIAREVFDTELEHRWSQSKMERIADIFEYPRMFLFDRDIIHGAARDAALRRGQEIAPASFADVLHDYRDALRFDPAPLMTTFCKGIIPKPRAIFLQQVVELGRRGLHGFFESHRDGEVESLDLVHPLWMYLCSLSSDPAGVFSRVGRCRALGRSGIEDGLERALAGILLRLDKSPFYPEFIDQLIAMGDVARDEALQVIGLHRLRNDDEWATFRMKKQSIVSTACEILDRMDAGSGESTERVLAERRRLHEDEGIAALLADNPHRLTSDPSGVLMYVRSYKRTLAEFGPADPDTNFQLASILIRLDRSAQYHQLVRRIPQLGPPAISALYEVLEQMPDRDDRRAAIVEQARQILGQLLLERQLRSRARARAAAGVARQREEARLEEDSDTGPTAAAANPGAGFVPLSREIDDSNHLQPRAPDGAGGRGGDAPQAGDPDLGETE